MGVLDSSFQVPYQRQRQALDRTYAHAPLPPDDPCWVQLGRDLTFFVVEIRRQQEQLVISFKAARA